ncbi:MAG: YabP/YqfC family sporulation protein [Clostridium sp.]|nr:YabP/YqfC family sporulation protein [Clostridium sp.]
MKTTSKTNKKSGRELLTDSLKLPRDMVLGEFKLSMTGNRELFIENYRGIAEYGEDTILLQTKGDILKITGKHLTIEYYTNEDMKISGIIANIQFGKEQQS